MKTVEKSSIVLLHGIFDVNFFDQLKKNKVETVFVLEGRPLFETSKATIRELLKRGITPYLISDNMAGSLFYQGLVKEIWLSYQGESKEGFICRIGALILAVLGKKHKVPVKLHFVPQDTEVLGKQEDILKFNGVQVAPKGTQAYVPLLDWVPEKYISQ